MSNIHLLTRKLTFDLNIMNFSTSALYFEILTNYTSRIRLDCQIVLFVSLFCGLGGVPTSFHLPLLNTDLKFFFLVLYHFIFHSSSANTFIAKTLNAQGQESASKGRNSIVGTIKIRLVCDTFERLTQRVRTFLQRGACQVAIEAV